MKIERMKIGSFLASLTVLATMATTLLAPAALADSRQKNKNDWRNLAGVGAAVAGYGLLKGDRTATVLGAAGAGYSAYRYEKDRHSQSQASAARKRYYRNYYRSYPNRSYYRTSTRRYYRRYASYPSYETSRYYHRSSPSYVTHRYYHRSMRHHRHCGC